MHTVESQDPGQVQPQVPDGGAVAAVAAVGAEGQGPSAGTRGRAGPYGI